VTSLASLIPRLRKYFGDRRAAPRCATRLEKALAVHVYLADAKGAAGETKAPRLVGYTNDVSETGLGIVLPTVRLAGRRVDSPERALRVVVGLPHEQVEMQVVGVRSVELEAGEPESGYLVGVHIREMAPDDRRRYLKYLRSLAVGDI